MLFEIENVLLLLIYNDDHSVINRLTPSRIMPSIQRRRPDITLKTFVQSNAGNGWQSIYECQPPDGYSFHTSITRVARTPLAIFFSARMPLTLIP